MAKPLSVSLLCSFSSELVNTVLKELKREDLFNVRITCKTMSCYATPLVFEELHVWFEEQSLQSLISIASDPGLGRNVKKLIIGMDYFYDVSYRDFKDYIYSIAYQFDPSPSSVRSYRAQRRDAWRVYRKYYLKQCALEKSGHDLAMMTQALRAFSSLVSVELMDFQSKGPRLLRTEKLLQREMLVPVNQDITIPRGGQQIRVLLQALAASDRKIEELTLHLPGGGISDTGCYGPLPEVFLSIAAQAFTGLKRLALDLASVEDMPVVSEKRSQESSLTTMLRAATKVERLSVEFPCEPDNLESWNDYIPIPRFGQLRELQVANTILHEADFALFLRSSCQRLQKLTIGMAEVKEESWDLIFETIRNLPDLETVCLFSLCCEISEGVDCFLEGIDAQPLYDYLLNRRKDSPWHSMCEAEWDQNRIKEADARNRPESDSE